ncbi:MAG: 16S rRNA (guanine(527)-N(7))-methyltransferase RsmG [Opitutales bacterium]
MTESAMARFFPQLQPAQIERLDAYAGLLREWNERINLVSRKDIENVEARHIAPSLLPVAFLQIASGARILDVGTGGGLPGIPLAIAYPEVDFLLVDAVGKKVAAVQEMADALGLTNLQTDKLRVQRLRKGFDFVVGRAVTKLPDFLDWTLPRIKPDKSAHSLANGVLYWKGGELEPALAEQNRSPAKIWQLTEFIDDPELVGKYVAHFPANNVRP